MTHWLDTAGSSELIACAWLLRQGYQAFRNVNLRGPMIDVVGYKDGKFYGFDVKTHDEPEKVKLRDEQLKLGILALVVSHDGKCCITDGVGVRLSPKEKTERLKAGNERRKAVLAAARQRRASLRVLDGEEAAQ